MLPYLPTLMKQPYARIDPRLSNTGRIFGESVFTCYKSVRTGKLYVVEVNIAPDYLCGWDQGEEVYFHESPRYENIEAGGKIVTYIRVPCTISELRRNSATKNAEGTYTFEKQLLLSHLKQYATDVPERRVSSDPILQEIFGKDGREAKPEPPKQTPHDPGTPLDKQKVPLIPVSPPKQRLPVAPPPKPWQGSTSISSLPGYHVVSDRFAVSGRAAVVPSFTHSTLGRPTIPVKLRYQGKTAACQAVLLNSGAMENWFHLSVAQSLGLDVTHAPAKTSSGIAAGKEFTGYQAEVEVEINGQWYPIPIYFSPDMNPHIENLLGHPWLMEHFIITHEGNTLTLTPKRVPATSQRPLPPPQTVRIGKDVETREDVTIGDSERRSGLYVLGRPGMGKTNLLVNLILQDIEHNHGLCFIDPHGDAIMEILKRIPDRRRDEVIAVDPLDNAYALGLNLFQCLDPTDDREVSRTVNYVMAVFAKLFAEGDLSRMPQMAQVLRNTTLTLIANPGTTMAEIPLLLDHEDARTKLVKSVTNPQVQLFWTRYNRMKTNEQREFTASTVNKLDEFLTLPFMQYIVGQSVSTIHFRQIMDQGKILLVKLSREQAQLTTLVGSLIIGQLLNAVYARDDTPEAVRRHFCLYCDEFQNFATPDFARLITEGRKYRLATTIAHQERVGQFIENKLILGATTAAANIVLFRPTVKDAAELAPEFAKPPQPAWEEEVEPEWYERKEEEVIDGVEEIRTPVVDVLNHLLSNKGQHPDRRVTEFVRDLYETVNRGFPFEKEQKIKFLSTLLFRANSGTPLQDLLRTGEGEYYSTHEFFHRSLEQWYYRKTHFQLGELGRGWSPQFGSVVFYFNVYLSEPTYADRDDKAKWKQFRADKAKCQSLLWQMFTAAGTNAFTEAAQRYADVAMPKIQKYYGMEIEIITEQRKIFEDFLLNFHRVLATLAKEPVREGSGMYQPHKRTQITYLTHPRKTVSHPQRTRADMEHEMAQELITLPRFTAWCKIMNEEHTHKTVIAEPRPADEETVVQRRLHAIRANTISGYCTPREQVQRDIAARQTELTKPIERKRRIREEEEEQ